MKKFTPHYFFVNALIITGTLITFSSRAQFITKWRTTINNEIITIPTTGQGYNYSIDWGDGNISTGQTGDAMHTYSSPGIYSVIITGTFPRIYFVKEINSRSKIIDISKWGSNPWTSMDLAFDSCTNLNISATDTPVLTGVSDMSFMFWNCKKLDPRGTAATALNNWHTDNIRNMSGVFEEDSAFNQDIGNWNTANVTSMGAMFADATAFNQDIGNWNTANVTDMQSMFSEDSAFNQDIGKWNTAKVVNMNGMFLFDRAFNQDIGHWNTANVTLMDGMFENATSFNQDISHWNTANVSDLSGMFWLATSFNQDIGDWNTFKVRSMYGMFTGATAFNQGLGNWRIVDSVNMIFMLDNCGLSVANYDQTLMGWAAQAPPAIKELDAWGLKYCAGAAARRKLVSVYGWTIVGDSLSCVLPPEPKVFPNPTTGLVTISNTQSGDVILLTDVIGQKLLTHLANGATQTLNINFVAQGDYFISIFRKDKIVVTKKIEKLH